MNTKESNKINKYLVGIIIVLVLLLSGVSYFLNSKITKLNMTEQNIKSLGDTIRITKNKLGEIEESKQVLVTENKDLKNLNKDLGDELGKEMGKVFNLTRIVAKFNNKPTAEPVVIHSEIKVYPDSSIGLTWDNDITYDEFNYRCLSGESKFKYDSTGVVNLGTKLFKDELGINLVTGLRELDGKLEIFVRSDYPGFDLTKLDGAIIDPKKNPVFKKFIKPKRFHFGPMIGVGVGNGLEFTPFIGVGGVYSIFGF